MQATHPGLAYRTNAKTGPVTTVITQHIKPGAEQAFTKWLRQVGEAAASFPGHQGLTVLPIEHTPRARAITVTYIFRFDSYTHLKAWEESPELSRFVGKMDDLLAAPPTKQTVTGLEYWFHLPGVSKTPPPRHKMAMVTILAIYPLSLLVPRGMAPFLTFLPPLARSLCYSVTLVLLMTYIVMPMATKIFAPWLFKRKNEERI